MPATLQAGGRWELRSSRSRAPFNEKFIFDSGDLSQVARSHFWAIRCSLVVVFRIARAASYDLHDHVGGSAKGASRRMPDG